MRYSQPEPISRYKAEQIFESSEATNPKIDALLSVTFHDPDYLWVESKCIQIYDSSDLELKRIAITCLGHLARIHGRISPKAEEIIRTSLSNDYLKAYAEDSLDDVMMFTKKVNRED